MKIHFCRQEKELPLYLAPSTRSSCCSILPAGAEWTKHWILSRLAPPEILCSDAVKQRFVSPLPDCYKLLIISARPPMVALPVCQITGTAFDSGSPCPLRQNLLNAGND